MKRKLAGVLATATLVSALAPTFALANASPPTEGGNGAGKSGQCTGKASERPAVCPGT